MCGSSTTYSLRSQWHLKAEMAILLKAENTSKYKAILNFLLKSIVTNSGS